MNGIHNTPHPASCACSDCRIRRAVNRALPYDSESAFLAFLARRGVAKFTSGIAGLCGTVAREIEALEEEAQLYRGQLDEGAKFESIRNGDLVEQIDRLNLQIKEIREAHGGAILAQSQAVERMEAAEEQFRKAAAWNKLTELEMTNLRSLKDDLEQDCAKYRSALEKITEFSIIDGIDMRAIAEEALKPQIEDKSTFTCAHCGTYLDEDGICWECTVNNHHARPE